MVLNHKETIRVHYCSGKTNDSLPTKHDITMKPVHNINPNPKCTPKNKATSKTEYTNAQQDLPVNGYNLVHLTRHAKFFGWRGLFCRKSD